MEDIEDDLLTLKKQKRATNEALCAIDNSIQDLNEEIEYQCSNIKVDQSSKEKEMINQANTLIIPDQISRYDSSDNSHQVNKSITFQFSWCGFFRNNSIGPATAAANTPVSGFACYSRR